MQSETIKFLNKNYLCLKPQKIKNKAFNSIKIIVLENYLFLVET